MEDTQDFIFISYNLYLSNQLHVKKIGVWCRAIATHSFADSVVIVGHGRVSSVKLNSFIKVSMPV